MVTKSHSKNNQCLYEQSLEKVGPGNLKSLVKGFLITIESHMQYILLESVLQGTGL